MHNFFNNKKLQKKIKKLLTKTDRSGNIKHAVGDNTKHIDN